MTDKYSGCNIVESVVTGEKKSAPRRKKRKEVSRLRLFLLRFVIAAILVCVVVAIHYFSDFTVVDAVKTVLHDVFCYDVFGRNVFGMSV